MNKFRFLLIILSIAYSCNNVSEPNNTVNTADEMYYFSRIIEGSMDSIVKQVNLALKEEGFGVISTIKIHEKLNEKLNVNFKPYIILGACNPSFAYEALQIENKIGTMLPCNVIIQELDSGKYEVAVINPSIAMRPVNNKELEAIATQVEGKLKRALDNI